MTDKRGPWLKEIPSVEEIIEKAFKELNLNRQAIFSREPYQVALLLEKKCHEIYNRYESKIREKFNRGEYKGVDSRTFENSLANSRRSRAGLTLEKIFIRLLKVYRIPYKKGVKIKEAEFDYAIPNEQRIFKDPYKTVLISLKRKVRERWKLTVGDAYILRQLYGVPEIDNIWFISLFEPPINAVTAMTRLNIRVYVPNGFYHTIINQVKNILSDEQISRIKEFSQVFEDLKPYMRVHDLSKWF